MEIKLEIPNLDKQRQLLKDFDKVHEKNLNHAIKETLKILQRKAKQLSPIDTGWLRFNILFRAPQGLYGRLEARATYSEIVHEGYGRGNRRKRPFFTNAISQTKTQWEGEFKKAEDKTLKKMVVR